jgi:hypothetical protein
MGARGSANAFEQLKAHRAVCEDCRWIKDEEGRLYHEVCQRRSRVTCRDRCRERLATMRKKAGQEDG